MRSSIFELLLAQGWFFASPCDQNDAINAIIGNKRQLTQSPVNDLNLVGTFTILIVLLINITLTIARTSNLSLLDISIQRKKLPIYRLFSHLFFPNTGSIQGCTLQISGFCLHTNLDRLLIYLRVEKLF